MFSATVIDSFNSRLGFGVIYTTRAAPDSFETAFGREFGQPWLGAWGGW